ncbi:MAG: aminotransferase class I/II-fold pyridoxal phosphate-dependent enzyme [Chloroflexi bacterium]|nr:MAG: aminotransferase class I/II-fold pyridoxal phosphate-dependent enzyme [Chloroflexota bacterium]
MKILDFRSDTVTLPTDEMRRAMAAAEVGDDQYGEDPTVNRLQELSAEIVGKEAGLFVASGMMGNLCGVLSQTERGDEIILGELAHLFQNEVGGYAVFGAIHPRTIAQRRPCPELADIAAAIRPRAYNFPRTALLCLENTHNWLGGAVITPEETKAAADLAHTHGLKVHLDGARIFNSAVAQGVDARDLTRHVDTVQFCYSKGLAAPVGSIICGPRETIERARKIRKMLGGAMRQAGVIAAAAIVAIDTMRDRLVEDHVNARRLADGLAAIRGVSIYPTRVETNIVAFELDPSVSGERFRDACAADGLRLSSYGGNWRRLRMVTHYGLEQRDVDSALEIMSRALANVRGPVETHAD